MSFSGQVDAWALKSKIRMNAVAREACQSLVNEAQTPRAKGGNMPVDTGFLRNSGLGALNKKPSGVASGDNLQATEAVILKLQAGDKFYFGWVANYAEKMESRYAFMRLAAQNWDGIVFEAVKTVKNQYGDS